MCHGHANKRKREQSQDGSGTKHKETAKDTCCAPVGCIWTVDIVRGTICKVEEDRAENGKEKRNDRQNPVTLLHSQVDWEQNGWCCGNGVQDVPCTHAGWTKRWNEIDRCKDKDLSITQKSLRHLKRNTNEGEKTWQTKKNFMNCITNVSARNLLNADES